MEYVKLTEENIDLVVCNYVEYYNHTKMAVGLMRKHIKEFIK